MAYRVIKAFKDGQDGGHIYYIGDEYPRQGSKPTKERIDGLLGTDNKQGMPLIKELPEVVEEPTKVEEKPRKSRRKKG